MKRFFFSLNMELRSGISMISKSRSRFGGMYDCFMRALRKAMPKGEGKANESRRYLEQRDNILQGPS